jgi:hypothetical protein
MHMDDEFRIGTVEDTFEFEANYGTAVHLSERSVRVGGPHPAKMTSGSCSMYGGGAPGSMRCGESPADRQSR